MNVEWAQEILHGPRILPQRGAIQGGPLLRTDKYGTFHCCEKNPQIYKTALVPPSFSSRKYWMI